MAVIKRQIEEMKQRPWELLAQLVRGTATQPLIEGITDAINDVCADDFAHDSCADMTSEDVENMAKLVTLVIDLAQFLGRSEALGKPREIVREIGRQNFMTLANPRYAAELCKAAEIEIMAPVNPKHAAELRKAVEAYEEGVWREQQKK